MSRTPHLPRLATAAVLALGIAAGPMPLAAQPQTQPPTQAPVTGSLSGTAFVEQAGTSGLFEIEAAKLARDKSRSSAIRAFADEMIKDHQAMAADLKAATGQARGEFTLPGLITPTQQTLMDRLTAEPKGAGFDRLYVETQIQAHRAAVGIFTAYASDGDQTALRAFAERYVPLLQTHLDHALALKG
ncbi:MAG: hypothetical protein B7Y70_05165 [Rhizobiales bacterium 35-68-8]|nr:MAG: hypothetical protein B7Y70_05165 [Rhizobiales bacterium 35-68-8]